MYGQGKYPHQFRHPSQQSQTNPPPPPTFQQAPTGPPLPPHLLNQPLSGPPLQYQHGLSYFPHSSQLYMPTLPLMQGNSSIPPPYSQPNMSYSSQHLYQPTPPRIFPPPPPPLHLQGQVLYQTPPPPPPGIQHVPAPPPPHPSGFASVTPAPFTLHGQSTTGDACPPSLPSPPPPPPPPPSPPPPLPPSPPPPSFPAAEFPGILKAIYPDAYDNFSASVSPNDNEDDKSMNKDPQLKAENLEDLHLSPPKPLDEEALKMGGSSQYGKFDERVVDSLSVSDMDMEDDVSHPDADMAAGDLGKESASEAVYFDNKIQAVADTFPAPMSTTNQLAPESLSSGTLSYTKAGTLSYTGSIHFQDDGVDGKVSPFLEDVSPVRNTPNAAEETQDNGQGSVGLPIEGSSQVNVSSTPVGCGTMETPGVYVKDGSPFRLIQGYDSDDSEEADGRENDHEINVDGTPTAAVGSCLNKGKTSKSHSSSTPDNVSELETGSNFQTDSSQLSPSTVTKEGESLGGLPDKATSQSVICPHDDPSNKVVGLQDEKWGNKIIKCEPSPKNNLLDGGSGQADHLCGKHQLEQDANEASAKLDVDEFGQLVRKGAGDNDSDDAYHSGMHVERGMNMSRSRSPQESKWRRRSRSPGRREKRSRSHSWSPRRTRSKSPSTSRWMNINSRGDRDQHPECLNFSRGRCFHGASCRFLHCDSARHTCSQHDISHHSGNHGRQDPAPYFELDKTVVTEIDIDEHSDVPDEDTKSIETQTYLEQSRCSTWSVDAGNRGEKDVSSNAADSSLLTVNNDIREVHVTNRISQEAINPVEKSQVDEAVKSYKYTVLEEPPLNSSQFIQTDSMLIQSASPGKNQPNQKTHPDHVSQPRGVSQLSQEGSLSHHLPHSHTAQVPVNQSLPLKGFPLPNFSGTDVNFQRSQQVPPGPPGHPPLTCFPTDTLNAPLLSQHPTWILHPPATGYQSPRPPLTTFHMHRPPAASDYHSPITPSNPELYGFPPHPPPSTLHAMPPRHDFNPLLRPYPPGEMNPPFGGDFHPQTSYSTETSHRHPFHMDELRRSRLPIGTHDDYQFIREDRFSRPTMHEGPQIMSDSQMDYHWQNRSSREGALIHSPDQGFASSSSFVPGNPMHTHSASLPLSNKLPSFPGEHHVDGRPFSREDFSSSAIKDLPNSCGCPSYGQQQSSSNNYPSNMNTTGFIDSTLQRYPSSFLDNRPPHCNPFASTFEQVPTGTKYVSNAYGRENDTDYSIKYGPPFSLEHASAGGELRLTSSPTDSKRYREQLLQKAGLNSQAGAVSDAQKLVRSPAAGDAYDPLFDSIEPSSVAKKLDHVVEPNSDVGDGGILSKSSSLHKTVDLENNKPKGSAAIEHKLEVDEIGEMATDAEVGVVENVSPQPENEWSPDLPAEGENPAAGEMEIDQVQSMGKSKRSKDSRSMKLFKVALADFVKEVLKPSWRQGNMRKEAFKTIVKKTVDKVSGAMPSSQIPKSQDKINQYVESSQWKLTKLVMVYVDKYVNM